MKELRGILLTNHFLRTDKFVEHYEWLSDAADRRGVILELWDNTSFLAGYGMHFTADLKKYLSSYQFMIYWDKDVRLGCYLTQICDELEIPIYNSVSGMAACDDKSETYRVLQGWNEAQEEKNRIPLLPTIVAPMTYQAVGYTDIHFLKQVTERLSLPLVIKECFGSFGQQVYLAKTYEEAKRITERLAGTPFLYQQYIESSHGHDIRLQVVGDRVVAAMRRDSSTGDFRANLTNGGSMQPYMPSVEEKNLAVRTVQALKLDFAGVDLLFSRGVDAPADVVCEVNSNAHFRNIADCTGINVADRIMDYICRDLSASGGIRNE